MYYIEINDGELKLECLGFCYEVFKGYITLIFSFEKLPHQLLKIGTAGIIIDKMKVYEEGWKKYKKYLPVYISSRIVSVISKDFHCTIHMRALKIKYTSGEIVKFCAEPECKHLIDYLFVMSRLLDIVGDEETADNIWNNELVEFLCCHCFVHNYK